MTEHDRPDVTCYGCGEEGRWCYMTGIGYVCSTCRRRAEDEDRIQEDERIQEQEDEREEREEVEE